MLLPKTHFQQVAQGISLPRSATSLCQKGNGKAETPEGDLAAAFVLML